MSWAGGGGGGGGSGVRATLTPTKGQIPCQKMRNYDIIELKPIMFIGKGGLQG